VRKQDGCEQREKNVVTEGEYDNEKDRVVVELGAEGDHVAVHRPVPILGENHTKYRC
jgi:hypothetical protein